ncbi:MAG: hypothetical protein Kow0029_23260 [Candidatus Rifleibacteriota bacterium]
MLLRLGKILKSKNRINLNAYLFANLAILVVLLISLWNRKPVWDVSIRFPNLLLMLIIINSILIFKNLVFAGQSAKASKKAVLTKNHKSLNALRNIVSEAIEVNETLYDKILAKLKNISGCEAVLIFLPENNFLTIKAGNGDLPPSIAGARFFIKDNRLFIRFPGNLGEEEVGNLNEKSGVIGFKSSIARLECTICLLHLRDQENGLVVFINKKGLRSMNLSLSSVSLFLETVIALVSAATKTGDIRYKDKSTGLLRHECFAESFETEIERSERYQQEMSLFSVKIRFCENCSDDHKKLLQKAAALALKQSLRRLDLMFCGENECEFLAILTETSAAVAEIVAKRVQKSFAKQIEKTEIDSKDEKILFIGSATYPVDATHGLGLLEKSREAMLQAEKEGREFVSYSLNEQAS